MKFNAAETLTAENAETGEIDARYVAEHVARARMRHAFETYFASTPEGQEEGKWLNLPAWQWIAAGSPAKIGVGKHPLRQQALHRFETEWNRRAETGEAMTMVPPPRPKFRFV